ncbi:MAG TPA: Ku protein [Bryobacteraceae bacterium]|nr:Ku protein [Bryobacteraceae bacterium]
MATAVWKGHLTFGLVSIPVKLYRAARPEKVSFRQLHVPRVEQESTPEEVPLPRSGAQKVAAYAPTASLDFEAPRTPPPAFEPPPPNISRVKHTMTREADAAPVERSEIVKGYEYAKDRYVVLTPDDLKSITPKTAREMEILEFVKLTDIDQIYFESSYYMAPDKGGEKAYALLLTALRQAGYVGLAQVAMQKREHIVLVRPGKHGIVLHTMFYASEVRAEDEYRADTSNIVPKELQLATMLIESLAAPFEPEKYRDTYREKLEAMIAAKTAGKPVEVAAPEPEKVINILEALQKSLAASKRPMGKADTAESPRTRKHASRRSGNR